MGRGHTCVGMCGNVVEGSTGRGFVRQGAMPRARPSSDVWWVAGLIDGGTTTGADNEAGAGPGKGDSARSVEHGSPRRCRAGVALLGLGGKWAGRGGQVAGDAVTKQVRRSGHPAIRTERTVPAVPWSITWAI